MILIKSSNPWTSERPQRTDIINDPITFNPDTSSTGQSDYGPDLLASFDFDSFLHGDSQDQQSFVPNIVTADVPRDILNLPGQDRPSVPPWVRVAPGNTASLEKKSDETLIQNRPMNTMLPPQADQKSETEYTIKVLRPEVARRQLEALKYGRIPPTEEQVRSDILREYQMSLMVLVCGDQSKRKKMYRVAEPDKSESLGSRNVLASATAGATSHSDNSWSLPSLARNAYTQPTNNMYGDSADNVVSSNPSFGGDIQGSFKDLGSSSPLDDAKSHQNIPRVPSPTSEYIQSQPLPGNVTQDDPLFVNPKQFDRIRERRMERQALGVELHLGDRVESDEKIEYSDEDVEVEEEESQEVEDKSTILCEEDKIPKITGHETKTGSQPSISNSISRVARKRTKSGCLTCRQRRIRCDFIRPTCTNCIKAKHKCDRYTPHHVLKMPAAICPPHLEAQSARYPNGPPRKVAVVGTSEITPSPKDCWQEGSLGRIHGSAASVSDLRTRDDSLRRQMMTQSREALRVQDSSVSAAPINSHGAQSDKTPGNVFNLPKNLAADSNATYGQAHWRASESLSAYASPYQGSSEHLERNLLSLLSNDGKNKRKRAACRPCRKNKFKCDSEDPCGTCSAKAIDCEYETARPSQTRKGYVPKLEERFSKLGSFC